MSNASSPTEAFDEIFNFLNRMEFEIEFGIAEGLAAAAPSVESDAKATTAYKNDTGATRASTTAYASQGGFEVHDYAAVAVEAANELRPGSADEDSFPPNDLSEDILFLDVMSATDYSYHLNTRNGLASMYLEEALAGNIQLIMSLVAEHVGEHLQGMQQ